MCKSTGNAVPRTYIGAYALCLDSLDQLLLCRMSAKCYEAGYWTLPGGGLDRGESPDTAVARELEEETGLKACTVDLAGSIFSEVYPPAEGSSRSPVHHIGILYRARGVTGALRSEIAGSTDTCAWFSREDAQQLPLTALGRFGLDVAWDKQIDSVS